MSIAPDPSALAPRSAQRRPAVRRTISQSIEGRIGLALGAIMIALIAIGPLTAPYPADAVGVGIPASPPSWQHLLGTDGLGRDVLSRVLTGGSAVVLVPLAAVTLTFLVGGSLGLLAAYRGGLVDQVIARAFDVLLTIPPLLTVIVLSVNLGRSRAVVILTVGLVLVPWVGRIARGAAQAVVTNDYVAAAVARSESTAWILGREVLPNAAAPLISAFTLNLTGVIVFVSTLSFLGLGDQPPSSSWGLMVAESRAFITTNPWATLAPALGIAAISVSFTLVGDAVSRHIARRHDHERLVG